MTTIYLVMGHTGSFDDYREWPVMAHANKASAEEHSGLAQAEGDRLIAEGRVVSGSWLYGPSKHDPEMQIDDGYVTYEVVGVPMAREPYTPRGMLRVEPTCATPGCLETENLKPDGEHAYCPEHR